MSALTAVERAVWDTWRALPPAEPAPVKTIAAQLDMTPADVAFIVYPAERFGAWADDQEPDPCCRDAILERRQAERQPTLLLLVDLLENIDLVGPGYVAVELYDALTAVGFRIGREWEPANDNDLEETS